LHSPEPIVSMPRNALYGWFLNHTARWYSVQGMPIWCEPGPPIAALPLVAALLPF
jgi:hypothetical protein